MATFTADESVSWSLSGGADQALFAINSSSGALRFANAPDYESPQDADANNSYVVTVRATDPSANVADQTVTVTVQNVAESSGSSSGDDIDRGRKRDLVDFWRSRSGAVQAAGVVVRQGAVAARLCGGFVPRTWLRRRRSRRAPVAALQLVVEALRQSSVMPSHRSRLTLKA